MEFGKCVMVVRMCVIELVEADNASYLCTCPFIESLSLCPTLILWLVAKILPPVSKNCRKKK